MRGEIGLDLQSLTLTERRYALRTTRQRLHQPIFRERVLHAYSSACAVCHLKHVELLDAAHIIEDNKDDGDPVISNGLALCKIHHAAFDRNLLGITPDSVVKINRQLMHEVDGPMLRHGLQEMHNKVLFSPRRLLEQPDRYRLDIRFQSFLNAS